MASIAIFIASPGQGNRVIAQRPRVDLVCPGEEPHAKVGSGFCDRGTLRPAAERKVAEEKPAVTPESVTAGDAKRAYPLRDGRLGVFTGPGAEEVVEALLEG